ncbi:MAG: hypothetical protein M3Y86_12130 [Verrucomicrobiota bacterium]|nr:hypothetical protein [Verrucomicrobiota bacterium]
MKTWFSLIVIVSCLIAAPRLQSQPPPPPTAEEDEATPAPKTVPAAAAPIVEKGGVQLEDLGPVPKQKIMDMVVSADQLHVATVMPSGSRQVVYHDGKPGPEFDEIAHFGAGSASPAIVMTRDGSHIAYLGRRGRNRLLYVDGKEVPVSLGGSPNSFYLNTGCFVFSPSGKHFAYFTQGEDRLWRVLVDDKEGPAYSEILSTIIFSEAGEHFAYLARLGQGQVTVVLDGNPGPTVEAVERIQFSPDGKHLAYWARPKNNSVVVLDGELSAAYEDIAMDSLRFSASNRLGYLARKKQEGREVNAAVAVIDGKESEPYNRVEQLQFSPDGARVGFVAFTPDGQTAVVDGKAGRFYDSIYSLEFSPDGSHVSYVAHTPSGQFVVIDEKESPGYNAAGHVLFSENGKLNAYTASPTGNGVLVVVNGHASKTYHEFDSIALSSDGSRYAYEAEISTYKAELVIDGKLVQAPNLVSTLSQSNSSAKEIFKFSPDSRHLAMASMVSGGGKYVVSVDGVPGPTKGWCAKFVFSKDSAHFAYIAYDNPTTSVVLDRKVVQTPTLLLDMQKLAAEPAYFQFRDDGRLKYLIEKGGHIFRVSVSPGAGLAQTSAAPPVEPTAPPQKHRPVVLTKANNSAVTEDAVGESGAEVAQEKTSGAAVTRTEEKSVGASDASALPETIAQTLSDGNLETLNASYAETVDYLNSGRISSDEVQSQLQEYFERWPVRHWEVSGPVRNQSLGASVQQITFPARFDLSDPKTGRHASGQVKETLTLAADANGEMKIISQHEQITNQNSSATKTSRPRGREKVYRGQRVDPGPIAPFIPWPFVRP